MNEYVKENNNQIEVTFFEHIKQIAKYMILQLKSVFSSPMLLFIVFGLPILFLCGVGIIVPTYSIWAACFSLPMIVLIGVTYANLKYSIDTSTFDGNISLTRMSFVHSIISIGSVLFIVSFLSFNIELVFLIICDSNNIIFMDRFIFQKPDSVSVVEVVWSSVSYSTIYYFYIVTAVLTASTYYFASIFFRSYRTFSVFVFVWTLVCLMFGGILSCNWNYYDSHTGEILSAVVMDDGWQNDYSKVHLNETSYEFDNWLSYTSFIVPQYFTNQHFFYTLNSGATQGTYTWDGTSGVQSLSPANYSELYWSKYDEFWNFMLLAPWIYSLVFILLATIRNLTRHDK